MYTGWLRAGVSDIINLGCNRLLPLDPFRKIDNQGGINNLTALRQDTELSLVNPGSITENYFPNNLNFDSPQESEDEEIVFDVFEHSV